MRSARVTSACLVLRGAAPVGGVHAEVDVVQVAALLDGLHHQRHAGRRAGRGGPRALLVRLRAAGSLSAAVRWARAACEAPSGG